ncbi:MAG: hypothetical protein ISQ54_08175 [Candidatus Poseidonia sp.]|nr:hypothetical protein [Poseidonia sp.]
MPILRGVCQEVGPVDRLEITQPAPADSADICPLCGQHLTCDVHWVEDCFSQYDIEEIRNDRDMNPNHNVYPGGTPGRFQPHLIVFVDHPLFHYGDLEDTLRRRIRMHSNPATRTLSIRFVSMTKRSMSTKMGTSRFQPLANQWRWMEPTFAPTIHFRTSNWSWQSRVF